MKRDMRGITSSSTSSQVYRIRRNRIAQEGWSLHLLIHNVQQMLTGSVSVYKKVLTPQHVSNEAVRQLMLTICPYMLLHRLCRARRFETRLVLLIPMMSPQRNVGIFWDYGAHSHRSICDRLLQLTTGLLVFSENCEVPFTSDGYAVAAGIRGLAERYGPIRAFKAYLEASTQSTLSPRLELISSGVDIVDCPHNGKKDVVDKTLMGMSPSVLLELC